MVEVGSWGDNLIEELGLVIEPGIWTSFGMVVKCVPVDLRGEEATLEFCVLGPRLCQILGVLERTSLAGETPHLLVQG